MDPHKSHYRPILRSAKDPILGADHTLAGFEESILGADHTASKSASKILELADTSAK